MDPSGETLPSSAPWRAFLMVPQGPSQMESRCSQQMPLHNRDLPSCFAFPSPLAPVSPNEPTSAVYGHIGHDMGFPGSSAGKESACSAGDPGSIPGLGSSPGEGIGYPLQCSCLENPHGQRSPVGCTTEQPSTAQAKTGIFLSQKKVFMIILMLTCPHILFSLEMIIRFDPL